MLEVPAYRGNIPPHSNMKRPSGSSSVVRWKARPLMPVLLSIISSITSLHGHEASFQTPAATATAMRKNYFLRKSNIINNMSFKEQQNYIFWPSNSISQNNNEDQINNGQELLIQQTRNQTEHECMEYLQTNLMSFDKINAESLGFSPSDNSHNELPDGLSIGIVGKSISLALDAKQKYPEWTSHVPKDIYYEYVLPYASVNEARTNWRPLFTDVIQPIVDKFVDEKYKYSSKDSADEIIQEERDLESLSSSSSSPTVEDIINVVNMNIWSAFNTTINGKPIVFKHGQTPLIYDPMSILIYGYASCTGVSIFLINALRSVGIPARLAGTDAWNGKADNGNHSWIEFYGSDGQWHILEAATASGNFHWNDDLYNPCQWWFCNKEKADGTTFYATRWTKDGGDEGQDSVSFPMAWDEDNTCVSGEDRTLFMQELCNIC